MCLGRNLVYIKRHKHEISEPNRKLTKPDLRALTASKNTCLTVLGIYHPLSGSAIEFLGELTEWLPENALLDTNPIIIGDFNLHVNNENDDDSMNFLEMILALGLKQNVMFDTHKSGNTLVLILTETESKITVKSVYKGEQLLDHSIVYMVPSLQKNKYEKVSFSSEISQILTIRN